MPRSRDTIDASLELLLDTITNTFGSVLFITMLVAIMLRVSGNQESQRQPVSLVDQANVEARVEELSDEIARLTVAIASLPSLAPEVAAVEALLLEVAQENARVLAGDAAVASEVLRDQNVAIEIERKAKEVDEQLERCRKLAEDSAARRLQAEHKEAALAALAVELDKPVDTKRITQTARLPELTDTKKRQFSLLMRYGRIYVMHTRGADGERLGPNIEHFIVGGRSDGRQSARARPDAGYIADGATISATLRRVLSPYPPADWVIAIVVNEDSFSQYQAVKAALVELGYQYEPFSCRENEGIWDAGGITARGQ